MQTPVTSAHTLLGWLPQEPCLGRRTADGYSWISYEDVAQEASDFGAGLRALGLGPKSKLGIYSVSDSSLSLDILRSFQLGFKYA